MDPTRKIRGWLITIILLLLVVAFTNYGRYIILRQCDAVRLAIFSRHIADADRAVAKSLSDPVEMTFSGADLQAILRAVSSGSSARMSDAVYMSAPFAKVTFYRGTNTLGQISMNDKLFGLSGGPSFFDNSTALDPTIYVPLRQKINEAFDARMK